MAKFPKLLHMMVGSSMARGDNPWRRRWSGRTSCGGLFRGLQPSAGETCRLYLLRNVIKAGARGYTYLSIYRRSLLYFIFTTLLDFYTIKHLTKYLQ